MIRALLWLVPGYETIYTRLWPEARAEQLRAGAELRQAMECVQRDGGSVVITSGNNGA